MNVEVSVAAIMPYPLLAAADNPLVGLGQAQVKGNSLLRQVITCTSPVTGEGRAGPEVAGVCVGRWCFLSPSIYTEGNTKKNYDCC